MELVLKSVGEVMIVTLPGETLDAGNTRTFRREIMPVIDVHFNVVFDLSAVRFIDSSGLGALLFCLRRLNAVGGDLKLCGLTKPVRALFELVRMHRIFEIFNDSDEAVRSYSGGEVETSVY